MTKTELAYIAGLFDGEGSCFIIWNYSRKGGKKYPCIRAKITSTDRKVLTWARSKFQIGSISSKRDKREKARTWSTGYDWTTSYAQARNFLTAVLPYLRIKKTKVKKLLSEESKLVTPRRASR